MVLDRSDLQFILLVMSHEQLTSREITRRAALRMRIADYLARTLPGARESEPCAGVPKE